MDLKEKDLIERVLGGDTAAFEPLVLPYRRPLFGLAYRMSGNREDALEIGQEALLRAFRYLGRCDLERGFRNWLYQILVNAARDAGRKRGREAVWRSDDPLPEAATAEGPGPEDARDRSEVRERIMVALDVLSAREREVFLLRDIEELSVAEAARALGCSSVAVRVHLSRARVKLRERMARS
jgi:RNA polymerase sigma-70 factor (ECF subfamily)